MLSLCDISRRINPDNGVMIMPRKTNTLARQWALLKTIPSAPRRLSTTELHQRMRDEGFEVDVRSIQRDLNDLSGPFPLVPSMEGRAHYWQWMEGSKGLEIPAMSHSTALVFQLAHQYLLPLMPASVLKLLEPYFARAAGALKDSHLADWKRKVVHIEQGPRLTPPDINPKVSSVVYDALLQGQRFEARYTRRYALEPVDYTVNPLGLVTRDGITYLVCTLWDYTDIKQLALHRMTSARLIDREATDMEHFDLAKYVHEDAAFAYPQSGEMIKLKALFDEGAAFHLTERALSADQTLRKTKTGYYRLTATVPDSDELRWWLLGFGNGVEVLAPKALRSEFKAVAADMARTYS